MNQASNETKRNDKIWIADSGASLVDILLRSFEGKITPKLIGDQSTASINCSLFEINLLLLGWLTRQDLCDSN